jgi:tetratricopeptide (TPR) repeat protein
LSTGRFSAFSLDLEALAHFFVEPWRKLVPKIDLRTGARIKSLVGFRLRTIGLLKEAKIPLLEALDYWKVAAQEDPAACEDACVTARMLSVLCLNSGDLTQALSYAVDAERFADNMPDLPGNPAPKRKQQLGARATRADALLALGQISKAARAFKMAEEAQKQLEPRRRYLYSTKGFRYLDFLLHTNKPDEVLARLKKIQSWVTEEYEKLDPALYALCEGLAFLLKGLRDNQNQFQKAKDILQRALHMVGDAGFTENIIRGLLAMTKVYRLLGELGSAQQHLRKAEELAKHGEMKLHQADCLLERTWLCLAKYHSAPRRSWLKKAELKLTNAKAAVEEISYGRRRPEIRQLEKALSRLLQNRVIFA